MPKLLKWDPSYSVGDATLDEQHMQLMGLCNRMAASLDEPVPADETFHDILDQLTAYAKVHFRTEEEILEACDYPRLATQREDHAEYERHVSEAVARAQRGALDERDLLSLLSSWWNDHILIADRDYKGHVMAWREASEGQSYLRADDFNPEHLARLRQDSGLSQASFWRRVGVNRSTGARYEAGQTMPESVRLMLMLVYGEEKPAGTLLNSLRQGKRE